MRIRYVAAVLALTAVACGPPITVRRVPPRQVTAELARSALNSDHPSLFSENVLNRWGLTTPFERDPAAALATLHSRLAGERTGSNLLFALAELCFQHADQSGEREYYLAAVVYAYAFLFPDAADERPGELDPRARIAADLYNRGLTQGFASRDGSRVELRSGIYPLPFGQQLSVWLDEQSLVWADRQLGDFVPVAELEVRGLGARFRNPGIGAPLAASMWPVDPEAATSDFVASEMKLPITAFLRIDHPRRQATQPVVETTLRLYNHYDVEAVDIAGAAVPLEAEPSATLAYSLSRSPIWGWERWGFLRSDLFSREFKKPITFVEPYRPGRIPVVFVHGTASSPGRWADMINVLMNGRRLRDRFQFWVYFYPTGNAIPYSAMRLRQTLTEVVHRIDPSGQDPALQQMVIIGHSQGGLLARMTAIDSGTLFWDGVSKRPIADLDVSDATRELLQEVFVFEPLPFVRQLVFIATPHGGSHVAANRLANWIAGFVRLPQNLAGASAEVITGNVDALRFDPRRPMLGSVYGMQPGSRFLTTLAEIPLAPDVTAHSIIPVRGDPPPDGQSDGVVRFESAHIDAVASELIVPRSGHSVQSNPIAIEEVRRILLEHADHVCAESGVACGPHRRAQ
ncbi:MAG: esterase/lipase family protein [Candidatus Binatia bacterium]